MKPPPASPGRPTPAEIQNAAGRTVADVIAPGLQVLFCGINPGLYSAAIGHHFGRPGNRFWPALHASGITPRLLSPFEERELLAYGYGITNVVTRATAAADELAREELVTGGRALEEKVRRYAPTIMAILGLTAYRVAFGFSKATIGLQETPVGGARVWVLPNPSGLNAHYSLPDLARLFRQVKEAAEME
jgi:TDG/mug DNA glycosylase family protein